MLLLLKNEKNQSFFLEVKFPNILFIFLYILEYKYENKVFILVIQHINKKFRDAADIFFLTSKLGNILLTFHIEKNYFCLEINLAFHNDVFETIF